MCNKITFSGKVKTELPYLYKNDNIKLCGLM